MPTIKIEEKLPQKGTKYRATCEAHPVAGDTQAKISKGTEVVLWSAKPNNNIGGFEAIFDHMGGHYKLADFQKIT